MIPAPIALMPCRIIFFIVIVNKAILIVVKIPPTENNTIPVANEDFLLLFFMEHLVFVSLIMAQTDAFFKRIVWPMNRYSKIASLGRNATAKIFVEISG